MTKILVFGDSIPWGAFDLEKGGWVERLKAYFFKSYEEEGVGVYNFSVSFNTSKGVLKFLESDIKKINFIEKEDYVLIFSVGSSDCTYINSKENVIIPKEKFEENLKKIISISKNYSSKIIFTGCAQVDESKTMPFFGAATEAEYTENNDIKEYDNLIKNICKKENIQFIPLFDLLTKEDLSDGMHPNSEGHRKIFERVKEDLNKVL